MARPTKMKLHLLLLPLIFILNSCGAGSIIARLDDNHDRICLTGAISNNKTARNMVLEAYNAWNMPNVPTFASFACNLIIEFQSNEALPDSEGSIVLGLYERGGIFSHDPRIKLYPSMIDNTGKRWYSIFVLQHEIGHAFGLDHNNNVRSIMYPYLLDAQYVTDEDKNNMSTARSVIAPRRLSPKRHYLR